MRFVALLRGDIRFQFKYGFYLLYAIFSLMYTAILQLLPEAWKAYVAVLMVFSDPAMLGLFFMGAILQFEKEEHTLHSIVVSPVNVLEYVLSKLFSLAVISTLVAVLLAKAGGILDHPIRFALAILFGSCLFSSLGLVLATKTETLNQFLLYTAPCELLITVPAGFYLFGNRSPIFLVHPGCSLIELCISGDHVQVAALSLLLWTLLFVWLAIGETRTYFLTLGGANS